jgi:hypothetical protein
VQLPSHANVCSCRSREATTLSSSRRSSAATSARQGATAAQLPRLNREDALAIDLLVIEHEPHHAERAAVRWLGRVCLERPPVTLAQVRAAVDAFALLVHDPDAAEGVLRRVADGSRQKGRSDWEASLRGLE